MTQLELRAELRKEIEKYERRLDFFEEFLNNVIAKSDDDESSYCKGYTAAFECVKSTFNAMFERGEKNHD